MHNLQTVIRAAQDSGILAVTSVCNAGCCFCSHQSNPSQVSVHTVAPLSLTQVADILMLMPKHPVITIGESTTTITEGEPFTHPDLLQILELVRQVFPHSLISITTNGTLLNNEWLKRLGQLQPLELKLSINCISSAWRRYVMPQAPPLDTDVIGKLSEVGVSFSGSLVALPHVTGWAEIEETLAFLAANGAQLVRVFLPGFTRYSPQHLIVPDWVWPELGRRVSKWRSTYKLPIVLEPANVTDLQAEVVGVMANTPAAAAGIQVGDVIESVDGIKPRSRVEAFQLVASHANPVLKLYRRGERRIVRVNKAPNERSGLVMDYDLSRMELNRLKQIAETVDDVAILTSELAAPRIAAALVSMGYAEVRVSVVRSRFFGGNIMNAGLLTVPDYMAALAEQQELPATVALSPASFDHRGVDLLGHHYREIEQCGVRVLV